MTLNAWRVVLAAEAFNDLSQIEDHLRRAYRDFGESPSEAAQHAGERVRTITADAKRIGNAPFRGAAHEDLMQGLRHLAVGRAVYWFVTDQATLQILVLAIFFGGQDHQRHMLARLLRKDRT